MCTGRFGGNTVEEGGKLREASDPDRCCCIISYSETVFIFGAEENIIFIHRILAIFVVDASRVCVCVKTNK